MKLYLAFFSSMLVLASCVSETETKSQSIVAEIPDIQGSEESNQWLDGYYTITQMTKGLKCSDVYLTRNGKKFKEEVTFGDKIKMNFTEIIGLEFPNEKCEVDLMFLFTSLDGDTLDYYPFGTVPPIIDTNKVQTHPKLSTFCFIVSPTFSGDSYYFTSGLQDMNTGKTVYGKSKITVKKNEHITITQKGLSCKDGFVYDPNGNFYVTNNVISKGRDYDFGILGLSGFTLKGDYANIGMRLTMNDPLNEDPFDSGDLMLSNDGKVKFSDINELLSLDFQVPTEFNQRSIHVEISVWDKNSDAKLSYSSDFTIAAS